MFVVALLTIIFSCVDITNCGLQLENMCLLHHLTCQLKNLCIMGRKQHQEYNIEELKGSFKTKWLAKKINE